MRATVPQCRPRSWTWSHFGVDAKATRKALTILAFCGVPSLVPFRVGRLFDVQFERAMLRVTKRRRLLAGHRSLSRLAYADIKRRMGPAASQSLGTILSRLASPSK